MQKIGIIIRKGKIEDLPELCEIYNEAIRERAYTCHTEEFSVAERSKWFYDHSPEKYPLLVCEKDCKAVGYATLSEFRGGRQALSKNAEISYYIKSEYRGKGIGTTLINQLLRLGKELGFKNIIAVIIGSNKRSEELLHRFGFESVGKIKDAVNFKEYTTSLDIYSKEI